jgi:hypothetical protein
MATLKQIDCLRCDTTFTPASNSAKYCKPCRPLIRYSYIGKYKKGWYEDCKEQGVCPTCKTNHPKEGRVVCQECVNKQNEKTKTLTEKYRLEALKILTNGTLSCTYCGDTTLLLLQIHHIAGGGRKDIGWTGNTRFRTIIKNGSDGFQAVCPWCHTFKHAYNRWPTGAEVIYRNHKSTEFINPE